MLLLPLTLPINSLIAKMVLFNKYSIQARVFPAIITILPAFIFSHFYLYGLIPKIIDSFSAQIISGVSITAVFIYSVAQISRFISKKFLQDKLFLDELYFPTVTYLLYFDNKYTIQWKEKIRKKIKVDFGRDLPTADEEKQDGTGTRRAIKEAVDLIRNKVKNGRLLLQHNIEYGFVRNLIGGMVISFPFSLFDSIFFILQKNIIAAIISILLFLVYSMILVNRKNILIYYANNYATVLFNEYLFLND
jgi:hypothetical protein